MASFVLTAAVMLPGVGVTVNGATRWLGAGPLQFQPSELLKLALILYTARLLAERPEERAELRAACSSRCCWCSARACALLMKQPDMGTTMVICFAIGALLVAAGTPDPLPGGAGRRAGGRGGHRGGHRRALPDGARHGVPRPVLRRRRHRLPGGAGADRDRLGRLFGVGLGESVQKIFYLPEAHTDMILAIIGEELGVVGMLAWPRLYGMIGYAGLRAAKAARDRYSKLLAAGITSLILLPGDRSTSSPCWA